MPTAEISTAYKQRPAGSQSKLRTYRDGIRIMLSILRLFKEEKPLTFFSILFAFLSVLSLLFAYPIIEEFLRTGLVPRVPTAILSASTMLLAFLCLASGFVLDTVTRGRNEMKRLSYLAIPALGD
jgi:O-antigen/teichoic acid export membrane protein